jgi:hypothetical protein
VNNATGNNNTATGVDALGENTTGSNNMATGNQGVGGESNTIRIGTSETQTATFVAGIRGVPITGGRRLG